VLIDHILYGLAWASFGLVHSALARPAASAVLERHIGCGLRLAYNGLAAAHLAAVLGLGWWLLGAAPPFDWQVIVRLGLLLPVVAGVILICVALARHDGGRFLGWRQVLDHYRGRPAVVCEQLETGGLYRWVRHPMYLGTLLVFWGLAQSPFGLATAVWGSLYLVIGAHFEERDLVRQFGDRYREYQKRVPMLMPWPSAASRSEPAA
jgi:protein-S-isoprenylcysteine O-methyltransferase Ste14